MPLQAKFKFGAMMIAINAADPKSLFEQASIFGELPHQCGKCQSPNIAPTHRLTKEQDSYYNLRCCDCGAIFDVGQKKDSNGLFPKFNPKDRVKCVAGWYLWDDQNFGNGGGHNQDDDRQQGSNQRQQQNSGGYQQGQQQPAAQQQQRQGGYQGNQQQGQYQQQQGQRGAGQGNGGYGGQGAPSSDEDIPFN